MGWESAGDPSPRAMAGDVSVQVLGTFALEIASLQSAELSLALTAATCRPCQTKPNPLTGSWPTCTRQRTHEASLADLLMSDLTA